jgi:type IV secretory pathway ATPase VirB11/archaellum biosynthesis ATPase
MASSLGRGRSVTVPAPAPPDDPAAWYSPAVQSQTEVHPGVVVTVRADDSGFIYEVREPGTTSHDVQALARVESYFEDAHLERPRTREGAVERMARGFDAKHQRVLDRLVDATPTARRRLEYHALCSLACFGELTPYALDARIDVGDVTETCVLVHTDSFAPARTRLDPETPFLERFASERLAEHTVSFHDFDIPVILYRENLLGEDPFTTKYAVREPDLLPGDEALIDACKTRIWEASVDGVIDDQVAFVRDRARRLLSRQLTVQNTRAWFELVQYRVRSALAEYDFAVPPVDHRFADDRLEDLLYYVLRDLIGYGKLTIPVRDPTLEDIEANRVGERIKVVPRPETGHNNRVPTNLVFEEARAFENVVTKLAADDGTELNASTPSAKVNLSPDGVAETIRCAVGLPTISEAGPHISIRKQSPDPMTPVDLLERNAIPTELVALLWLLYEHHGVVLFCGPTGVGKTTLMNAHMPFIPYRDRPISIDEGSREVYLPHETSVSLTTREHERDHRRVTMADLMTECNYLNPDVEVIAEVNSPESFQTFAETLNTGHGLLGTTHADDIETLVNRAIEQGLEPYLIREIDLLVFPRRVDDERYVGEVIELVDEETYRELESAEGRSGVVRHGDHAVYWAAIGWRDNDGSYRFGGATDDGTPFEQSATFRRLARRLDTTVDEIQDRFTRRHRYVRYLEQEGIDDIDELFAVLSDLHSNEAATVERLRQQQPGVGRTGGHGGASIDGGG